MTRKLTATVSLVDDDGTVHRFGPDDDVPGEYAERITNPDVWDDGKGDAAAASSKPAPADEDDSSDDADESSKSRRRHK